MPQDALKTGPKSGARQAPVKPGQVVELEIESLAYGGDGVARLKPVESGSLAELGTMARPEAGPQGLGTAPAGSLAGLGTMAPGPQGLGTAPSGYTVFVPFSAPGDRVKVRMREVKRTYARADILEVLSPGAQRVAAPCPVAGRCGGCSWQHLAYPAQLEAKRRFLSEALARIGGLAGVPVEEVLASPRTLGYRNKAQVPFSPRPGGGFEMGFFAEGSHRVVPLPESGCAIQPGGANRALKAAEALLRSSGVPAYDEGSGEGELRHLLARVNSAGQVMLVFVTRGPVSKALKVAAESLRKEMPELVSVLHNRQPSPGNLILGGETRLLAGQDHLVEELGGLRFKVSATSFFQVNSLQVEAMWSLLLGSREWSGKEGVLELYCGVGTLSLPLAKACGRLLGLESSAGAVRDARENAALNGVGNASFFQLGAEAGFDLAEKQGFKPEVLVVDPPRKGLEPGLTAEILKHRPAEILYVSCDPASLARDLGALARGGYGVERVRPLDLFPQTYHVESVTCLKWRGSHG